MQSSGILFIVLGAILLLGLAADYLGRRTALPRVTLLLLFGFLVGSSGLKWLPEATGLWFPHITDMALLLVGFLLGGKMIMADLRANGRVVLLLSLSAVLVTLVVVTLGLFLLGVPWPIALLLAGIATATDPAATLEVINEYGARGRFTDTLVQIVAIDDAWGLITFSVVLALVHLYSGNADVSAIFAAAAYELFGAVLLGVVIGLPMAYVSGRIKPGQPTLVEAMGMVLLCGGLAQWFEVSYLLSAMVLGMVVANLAKHHERPFHEIEDIEWPFMVLFFVLTGASLKVEMLADAAFLLGAYVVLRFVARVVGCWPGGWLSDCEAIIPRWMGLALLPQAGVAMGMALIVTVQLPHLGEKIIPVVVVATIFFEAIGPVFTRLSLTKVGDISGRNGRDT